MAKAFARARVGFLVAGAGPWNGDPMKAEKNWRSFSVERMRRDAQAIEYKVPHKQVTGETSMSGEKFGAFIRARREAKEIGLREMAKMIGVSPTYVSKVERDEVPPPAEDKVRLIAGVIGCDVDELLARAGKVATDLSDIIKHNPAEVAALLRATKGLTADELTRLARAAQKMKNK